MTTVDFFESEFRAADWLVLGKDDFGDIGELLTAVESAKTDLIVTYRHIGSTGWRFEHSLSSYLDVLTQATTVPVCVLPHPLAGLSADHGLENTDRVMAMANHLVGDARLVNWASTASVDGGHLFLAHIEDECVFQRYADAIGKIPTVDTDTALASLRAG